MKLDIMHGGRYAMIYDIVYDMIWYDIVYDMIWYHIW